MKDATGWLPVHLDGDSGVVGSGVRSLFRLLDVSDLSMNEVLPLGGGAGTIMIGSGASSDVGFLFPRILSRKGIWSELLSRWTDVLTVETEGCPRLEKPCDTSGGGVVRFLVNRLGHFCQPPRNDLFLGFFLVSLNPGVERQGCSLGSSRWLLFASEFPINVSCGGASDSLTG